MLLEEFKYFLSEHIVVYLNKQKVTTLQQAASFADEFALMHKALFTKHDSSAHNFSQGSDVSQKTSNTRAPVPHLGTNMP